MGRRLHRSISQPIRGVETFEERWRGEDKGLIFCWELGRLEREDSPWLREAAERGELVVLGWKGGVSAKLKVAVKIGTLQYLAKWQGLRGEDLDIDLDGERRICCTRTGQVVSFSSQMPDDDEYAEGVGLGLRPESGDP